MLKFIRKKLFKRSLLMRFEREAWQNEINADYDASFIADLEKIAEAKRKEIGEIGDAHERKKRDRRKQLESEVEKLEQGKTQILQAVENQRQRAAEIRNRAEFVRRHL